MLNPLSFPTEVVSALRSVLAIERLLDQRLAQVDERLRGLEIRMATLPEQIEETLRSHFSGQREDLAGLHEELAASRIEAEKLPAHIDALPPHIDAIPAHIDAVRDELRGLLAELTEVRETVEPLQGPAERVARLEERLPGGG
jgi:chromosome segregation ATPase